MASMPSLGGLGLGGMIGKAVVQLELDSKKYLAEMNGAKAETQAGATSMSKGFTSFGTIAKTGLLAAGAAAAVFAVKSVAGFQEVAGETRTLEKQLGITAEQASVLRAQGEALGVGTDKLSTGFGILAKHLVANDAITQQYGLTVNRTSDGTIDFQDILGQLSETFSAMGPSADRTAAAMNLFGRSGKTLLPLLAANSAELGKLADEAERAGLIMSEDDVQAARDLSIAQRQLGEAFKGLQVEAGRALVPMLTELAHAFTDLLPLLRPLARNLKTLLEIFLGYKAITFIPTALGLIAKGIVQVQAASGASLSSQIAVTSAFSAATAATVEFTAAVAAIPVVAYAAAQALSPLSAAEERVAESVKHAGGQHAGYSRAVEESNKFIEEAAAKAGMAAAGITSLGGAYDDATHHVNRLGHVVKNFAGMSDEALKDFRKNATSTFTMTETSLDSVGKVFTMTSHQAVEAMQKMAKQAKQMGQDLKKLDQEAIPSKLESWLITQGPAAVHAFVTGTEKQKGDFVKAWKGYEDTTKQTTRTIKGIAANGGQQVGAELAQGVARGLVTNAQGVTAAARQIIRDAIQAARDEADSASPSKKMQKLGEDLIQGLRDGLDKEDQGLYSDIQKIMDTALKKWKEQLDKMRSAAGDFRGSISGAFSSFLDLPGAFAGQQGAEGGGMPLLQMLEVQKLQAQDMADVLEALKRQGASKGLLSQIAGAGPEGVFGLGRALLQGGPEAISTANETLASIQKIQNDTAKTLTNDFFKQGIDRLTGKIDRLGDIFDRIGNQIENHSHDIIVDGDRLAVAVRSSSLQGAKRNGGKTGF
jgi:hypothetical protein